MGEHSYNLQAPKDKMGKNITPYDEYLAGADPQAEAKAYWDKQQKGKTSARDKNERTEYDEKVDRYNQIRKDKPHLRPVMPEIPKSIRRDFPNLRPGQKTPTGTTTTAPSGPAPAGATSQGGTTTIETGPKAVITMPQGQLGGTTTVPSTGGFQPMSGTPGGTTFIPADASHQRRMEQHRDEQRLLQSPQGQRLSGSMENATKQLVNFTQTMPDQGKARELREGIQLASYSGDSFDGFPKKIDNTVIGRAFAAAQKKEEESALRPQQTGGGTGTHMQGTGPQQYGGAMDARYLRASYQPSTGDVAARGSVGGDGRGGGASDYGPSSAPTNAPTGPGVETYSPVPRVPRSQRQSPYQRPDVPGREVTPPESPTTQPPADPNAPPPAAGAPSPAVPGSQAPQGPFSDKPTAQRQVNYFQRRGDQPLHLSGKRMATVQTPQGKASAHPEAAADFSRFANAMHAAGAPIKSWGSYNPRQKRAHLGGSGWSSHAYAASWDINNVATFAKDPKMAAWIRDNPEEFKRILSESNMRQPLPDTDAPHIEWTGPGARDKGGQPPATAAAPPATGPQAAAPTGPQAAPTTPPTTGPGGGGGLAADRAKFKAELDANPALREKVLRIAANEQGKHGLGTQAGSKA